MKGKREVGKIQDTTIPGLFTQGGWPFLFAWRGKADIEGRLEAEQLETAAELKLRAERKLRELLAESTVKGGKRHKLHDGTYERVPTLPDGISKPRHAGRGRKTDLKKIPFLGPIFLGWTLIAVLCGLVPACCDPVARDAGKSVEELLLMDEEELVTEGMLACILGTREQSPQVMPALEYLQRIQRVARKKFNDQYVWWAWDYINAVQAGSHEDCARYYDKYRQAHGNPPMFKWEYGRKQP